MRDAGALVCLCTYVCSSERSYIFYVMRAKLVTGVCFVQWFSGRVIVIRSIGPLSEHLRIICQSFRHYSMNPDQRDSL